MKSNKELGFKTLLSADEYVRDAGGHLCACVQLGRKGDWCRAYAYLWRHDQDASREGLEDSIAVRGEDAEQVLDYLAALAADQWDESQARGVRGCIAEIRDALADRIEL